MYEKIGVVVTGDVGSEIAALVFVDGREPLYILPAKFFIITDEDRQTMSKTQISKKDNRPNMGQNIEFNVNGRIITEFERTQPYRTTTINNNNLQVSLKGFINCFRFLPNALFQTKNLFGVVGLEPLILFQLMSEWPNLQYQMWFIIVA